MSLPDLALVPDSLLYLLVALIALLVGSVLNMLIYRLPKMIEAEWQAQCQQLLQQPVAKQTRFNLFFPRSLCPKCKTSIPIWHNIPLLSYILLLGRCHRCRQPIPWRYPLVELLSLALSLFCLWHFGPSAKAAWSMVFCWLLIPIAWIDLEQQIIPDSLNLGLLWLGLIANTQGHFVPLETAVLAAVVAYLSLWLLIQLYYLLRGKIGMGHGDFKLFAAFGAWFGFAPLPLILLAASLLGAVLGLAYLSLAKQGKETPIPFGPFLCTAGLVTLFWGPEILHWYLAV